MNSMPQVQALDEPVETAIAAISAGWATPEEIADAVEARRAERPLIGQLMLKLRKLSVHQVFEVLAEESDSNKLFGQITIEKGFSTEADIDEMLALQHSMSLPLWLVLVNRNVITPAQAESIQTAMRERLRKPLEAYMVA